MKTRTLIVVTLVGGLGLTAGVLAAGKLTGGNDETAQASVQPGRPLANFVHAAVRQIIRLRADLNITEDQRTQIREVIKTHREQIVPAARNLAASRQALREAVLADNPDEDAIRTAAGQLGDSIANAAVLASRVAAEVKPLLTEAQKQTLREFQGNRQQAVGQLLDEALPE